MQSKEIQIFSAFPILVHLSDTSDYKAKPITLLFCIVFLSPQNLETACEWITHAFGRWKERSIPKIASVSISPPEPASPKLKPLLYPAKTRLYKKRAHNFLPDTQKFSFAQYTHLLWHTDFCKNTHRPKRDQHKVVHDCQSNLMPGGAKCWTGPVETEDMD